MKKLTLLPLLVALLFIGACGSEKKSEAKETTAPVKEQTSTQVTTKTSAATFNYTPTKPVNGTLKGVVELGASGFNSFIVNVDKDNNYEVKSKEFGNSLIIEGMTNVNEVTKKLKDYIQKIVEFGVKTDDIHFVVSSGAKISDTSKIIIRELKNLGYVVNEVTAEEEGIYALKAVLPNEFKSIAYVVDIGSGNTKVSYYEGNEIVGKDSYGAKYFQNDTADELVYKEVRSIAATIPKGKKSLCFIIGGVPFNMAKSIRKEANRFTMLSTDIDSYKDVVTKKGKKVESGLNIFKAIGDETGCKRFVFDWDANFTIGFLLSLNDKE
ncbi:hypothetical protein [Tenacibaculum haliotis]|uniref:hypothetical protein n=1 Tax=Tenacibaculum haliotis TaxID=1888914 RepID=UPI0021B0245F|nr:hypothetical protein [Tenacibaculum haliotis]MCT4700166.1 hypothetical protein [Tenacibaculum haliotis]